MAMGKRLRLTAQALLRRLTKRLLGRNACAIVARTPAGFYFAVDPDDVGPGSVGRGLLRGEGHAEDEIAGLRQNLTGGERVLVVGAHIGTLVVPISRCCREIVAIEANPRSYALLQLNLAMNGVHNCRSFNLAASDKQETLEFLANSANSGGSKRVPKIKEPMYYYDRPCVISVEAVRLDDLLAGEPPFDVVIMDIEGSEPFALAGMQRILASARMLQIEFLPHHLRNVGGVTVEQFVALIAAHFATLTIPSKRVTVEREDFVAALSRMYDADEGDGGILFRKPS